MSTVSLRSFLFLISATLATGFGVGRIPWMPGTWGSLLGCAVLFFLPVNLALVVGTIVLSLIVIHHYEKVSQKHDSSQIIIDEIQEVAESYGGALLSKKYKNMKQKLKWKCSEGHIFYKTAGHVLHREQWCSVCSKENRASKVA